MHPQTHTPPLLQHRVLGMMLVWATSRDWVLLA